MTAMNRYYSLNSERYLLLASLGYYREWSLDTMRSIKVKQKRLNCVNRYADGPGIE